MQTSSHLTACFLEHETQSLLGTFGNFGLQSFHRLYKRLEIPKGARQHAMHHHDILQTSHSWVLRSYMDVGVQCQPKAY